MASAIKPCRLAASTVTTTEYHHAEEPVLRYLARTALPCVGHQQVDAHPQKAATVLRC
jgi:hypothetical protein